MAEEDDGICALSELAAFDVLALLGLVQLLGNVERGGGRGDMVCGE
jgi:hypothetical protein